MLSATPDVDVENAVELATYCREFHVLPRAGGLYDQDYVTMRALWYVLEAWAERDRIEQEKAQAKHKRPVARR